MSLEDILPGLNSSDPQTRRETVRELVRLRAFETVDILRKVAKKDPDQEVRTLAAGAIAFFEREPVQEEQSATDRRSVDELPDISDVALLRKEIRTRRDEPGLLEYSLMGFLVLLVAAIIVILIANGIKTVREGVEDANRPVTDRSVIVAEMRQAIETGRSAADQLAQLPTLIRNSPAGVSCDTLPNIPPLYRRSEAELEAYPELGPPQWALNRAYINIHDVQRRWYDYCTANNGLREVPDHILSLAGQMIEGGRKDLEEAVDLLDQIAE